MYTERNFKSKKEMKEAVLSGAKVGVYSPGSFPCLTNGEVSIEGPHFPKPHSWYAWVRLENGYIVKVLS
jgi:hypothetical protein